MIFESCQNLQIAIGILFAEEIIMSWEHWFVQKLIST